MSLFSITIYVQSPRSELMIGTIPALYSKYVIGPNQETCVKFVDGYKNDIHKWLKGERTKEIRDRLETAWVICDLLDSEIYNENEYTVSCHRVSDFINVNFTTIVDKVYAYNERRGFLTSYDGKKEAAYILEELMEMFIDNKTPKETAREVIKTKSCYQNLNTNVKVLLDCYADIIIFCLGAMMKLLFLSQEEAYKSQDVVKKLLFKIFDNITDANLKKSMNVDSEGKNIKGEDFETPFIPHLFEEI